MTHQQIKYLQTGPTYSTAPAGQRHFLSDFHAAASWQQYVVGLAADSRYNLPTVCNVFC